MIQTNKPRENVGKDITGCLVIQQYPAFIFQPDREAGHGECACCTTIGRSRHNRGQLNQVIGQQEGHCAESVGGMLPALPKNVARGKEGRALTSCSNDMVHVNIGLERGYITRHFKGEL